MQWAWMGLSVGSLCGVNKNMAIFVVCIEGTDEIVNRFMSEEMAWTYVDTVRDRDLEDITDQFDFSPTLFKVERPRQYVVAQVGNNGGLTDRIRDFERQGFLNPPAIKTELKTGKREIIESVAVGFPGLRISDSRPKP